MNSNLKNTNILSSIIFNIINFNWFNNKNKIKLKKDSITIKFSNKKILYNSNADIVKFTNLVKNFLITLNRECKNFNPTLFLNLYQETLFKIDNLDSKYSSGNYYLDNNNSTYSINSFKAIYHELLHLASSKKCNEKMQTGFSIYTNPKEIENIGVTEAYTQILAERYFNENVGEKYVIQVLLVKKLELIIGKNNMEKFFFKADYFEFRRELAKYISEDQIDGFIYNMDFITKAIRLINKCLDKNIKIELDIINQVQLSINKVSKFLFECFKNKINYYENFNISELFLFLDEYNWTTELFLDKDHSFKLLNMEEYNTISSEIRNCINETIHIQK